MMLEKLYGALVPFSGGSRSECTEVATLPAGGFLPRVKSILTIAQFADHIDTSIPNLLLRKPG
jgi:hypothetical protein